MRQPKTEELRFFEGIILGVYGNWLITYLDKISFSISGWILWFQYLAIPITVVSFALFFYFTIIQIFAKRKRLGVIVLGLLGALHFLFVYYSLSFEVIYVGTKPINLYVFMMIGTFLWVLLFGVELDRLKLIRTKRIHRSKKSRLAWKNLNKRWKSRKSIRKTKDLPEPS